MSENDHWLLKDNALSAQQRQKANIMKIKPDAYFEGYEAKKAEIAGMGFEAARDKFNTENPVGMNYATANGYWYAHGEFDALCGRLEK